MTGMRNEWWDLTEEEASRLHTAAIVGTPHLAWELESVGISDPESALADAQGLRPMILRVADIVRDPAEADRFLDAAREELERRRSSAEGEAG